MAHPQHHSLETGSPEPADARPTEDFPTFRRLGRAGAAFGRKASRALGWAVVAVGLLHCGVNLWAGAALDREMSALRARNEPLRLEQILPGPVPERENAAPLYLKAEAAATPKRELPARGRSFSAELLEQNREAIRLTRRAAQHPQCRFEVDWSNPPAALLPHLAKMRHLARLMREQAVREAKQGNVEQALADVDTLFRMSRHLLSEPILISLLVGRAVEDMGYMALAEVTQTAALSRKQSEWMRARLPGTDWEAAVVKAMQMERAFGLWCFERLPDWPLTLAADNTSGEGAVPAAVRWGFRAAWAPVRKLDEIFYARFTTDQIKRIRLFAGQKVYSEDEIDRAMPPYAVMTRMLFPVYARVLQVAEKAVVQRRLADAMLVLNTSKDPRSDPEYTDPYSGNPFQVHAANCSELWFYSVGPNRKDDGGVEDSKTGADDIAFTDGRPRDE